MTDENRPERDPYAFSLRGLTAAASFGPVPALADDRLNRARDERLCRERKARPDRPDTRLELSSAWGRFWLRRRRRAA